jgi:hypothetical protein
VFSAAGGGAPRAPLRSMRISRLTFKLDRITYQPYHVSAGSSAVSRTCISRLISRLTFKRLASQLASRAAAAACSSCLGASLSA